ncbi:putative TetR family transcriptional regulator [Gordonia araii NBRC 100433]|uniref:Putative TetR family transcriptional regulator n=1 Tax=Gordonia araii NBRC 100433 TaxID=1073574 RepID=G7H6U8_9ACTN|nr:hypothetical protein [Gordonia araii]NNG95990.1 hypothetical protein [Gordonia araii NBRC 100433]GAB11573.1 putative TetR family transcriptional regulator [Gordonia araii NBRC 100433]
MARTPLSPQALLDVSRRCAAVIAEKGSAAHTKELVEASGFSERTYFRYFPTKGECIRPLLDHGDRMFAAEVARRCAGTDGVRAGNLLTLVVDAFVAAYDEGRLPFDRALLVTILADPPLRRIWLETNDQTARLLAPSLARVLGVPDDHIDALVAADQATLLAVTTVKRMVQTGESAAQATRIVSESIARQPISRQLRRDTP